MPCEKRGSLQHHFRLGLCNSVSQPQVMECYGIMSLWMISASFVHDDSHPRFLWLKVCQVPPGLLPGPADMDLFLGSLLPLLVAISAGKMRIPYVVHICNHVHTDVMYT